jgi:hypothetical protein
MMFSLRRKASERFCNLRTTPLLDIAALPFALGDTTAGSETELQAVVAGGNNQVDLPISISQSNYFANIMRRAAGFQFVINNVISKIIVI